MKTFTLNLYAALMSVAIFLGCATSFDALAETNIITAADKSVPFKTSATQSVTFTANVSTQGEPVVLPIEKDIHALNGAQSGSYRAVYNFAVAGNGDYIVNDFDLVNGSGFYLESYPSAPKLLSTVPVNHTYKSSNATTVSSTSLILDAAGNAYSIDSGSIFKTVISTGSAIMLHDGTSIPATKIAFEATTNTGMVGNILFTNGVTLYRISSTTPTITPTEVTVAPGVLPNTGTTTFAAKFVDGIDDFVFKPSTVAPSVYILKNSPTGATITQVVLSSNTVSTLAGQTKVIVTPDNGITPIDALNNFSVDTTGYLYMAAYYGTGNDRIRGLYRIDSVSTPAVVSALLDENDPTYGINGSNLLQDITSFGVDATGEKIYFNANFVLYRFVRKSALPSSNVNGVGFKLIDVDASRLDPNNAPIYVSGLVLTPATASGFAKPGSGAITATYQLPGGVLQTNKTYAIEATYYPNIANPTSPSNAVDTNHYLTINTADVTVLPVKADYAYSTSQGTVTLTAGLTSVAGVVNAGKVTFSVFDGVTLVGSTAVGTVSNGVATASYTIPASQHIGTYKIVAAYTNRDINNVVINFNDSTSTANVNLLISPASVITSVDKVATYGVIAQKVPVSATVKDKDTNALLTGAGSVTFRILKNDKSAQIVGGTPLVVSTNTNGVFSGSITLPGGLGLGVYYIEAVYSSSTYAPSSTSTNTLTINQAPCTIAITTFPPVAGINYGTASVLLGATVTPNKIIGAAGTLVPNGSLLPNKGTITYKVKNSLGTVVGTATSSTVFPATAALAKVTYLLPISSFPAGTYTIYAEFTDNISVTPLFADCNTSTNAVQKTFIIKPLATKTSFTTASYPATATKGSTITVSALVNTAAVTNPVVVVGEGTVSFSIKLGSAAPLSLGAPVAVVAGVASKVDCVVPANAPSGNYVVIATYTPAVAGSFTGSTVTSPTTSTLSVVIP